MGTNVTSQRSRPLTREGLPVGFLIVGCLITMLVSAVVLTALERGVSIPPLIFAPIVAVLPFVMVRVDIPRALPVRLRAPLDRLALLFLTLSMLAMTMNGVRAVGSLAVSDVFLLLGALAATPAVFDRRLGRNLLLPWWIMYPALALLIVGTTSIVFFDDSLTSLAGILRLLVALMLVPFAVASIGGTQRALPWLVDMWIFSAMVNSAVAIADFGFQTEIGNSITHVISNGRSTGLTTHSNHLGVAMCMTTPLVAARLITAKTPVLRAFFFVALGVLGLSVLATGSRGALVAYVIAALLGTAMMPEELRARTAKRVAVAFALGLLVGSITFGEQAKQSVERLTGGSTTARGQVSESDSARASARAEGIKQFESNPVIGAGLKNAEDAHMIYLQLAASSGLIGVTAFLTFLGGSVLTARRLTFDRRLGLEERAIVAGAGAAVLTWALLGLVENQVSDRYLYVPSGLIVAGLWYRSLADSRPGADSGRARSHDRSQDG